MQTILKKVRKARARLMFGLGLQVFVRTLFWVALAAALLLFAQRWIRPLPLAAWIGLGAAPALIAAGGAILRRPSMRTAAIALDQAAKLEDRLAAALFVRDEDGPVAHAIRRNAEDVLLRAGRVSVPLPRPALRRLAIPAVLGLAALILPGAGGSGRAAAPRIDSALQTIVPEPLRKEESERLRRRAFSLEKQARESGRPELQEIADALRKTAEELRKEDLTRNEALARLSTIEEKSRSKKESIAARMPESLLQRMKGQGGDTSKSAELKKAEMAKKLSELSKAAGQLKDKLGQGGLSAEEKAKLDHDLKDLAAALGKELGSDLPGDLQQRLDKMLGQGEGRDQKELSQMLDSLSNSLTDLEILSQLDEEELDALLAAKEGLSDSEGTCLMCGKSMHGEKGGRCGSCRGLGDSGGAGPGEGPGGGPGRGTGGGPGRGPKGESNPEDPSFPTRPQAALNPGDIIGAIQFKSLPEKGQLRSAYAQAYKALSAEATQAIQQEEIPAGYRIHVRDYFESIRPDKDKK